MWFFVVCFLHIVGGCSARDQPAPIGGQDGEFANTSSTSVTVAGGRTSPVTMPRREDILRMASLRNRIESLTRAMRNHKSWRNSPSWLRVHSLLVFSTVVPRTVDEEQVYQELIRGVLEVNSGSAFYIRRGRPQSVYVESGFEGQHHKDQFLHLLATSNVGPASSISGTEWQLSDLINSSSREVTAKSELPWSISAWASYCPNRVVVNKFGEECSLATLVRSSLDNPDGTCGFTHWYFGLARAYEALNVHQPSNDKLMLEIRSVLDLELKRLARGLHPDGWLLSPSELTSSQEGGLESERNHILYTGHCLEWATRVCADEELSRSWGLDACERLLSSLESCYYSNSEISIVLSTDKQVYEAGNLMHAVSGLLTWFGRVSELGLVPSAPINLD